ncbi:hypothetical protein WAI453_005446 [Rhynchosporium graminicola]
MALRMGIGDVFTLCKSAGDVCSRAIHEEHEGTNTLITEMKQIRSHLKSLEVQIGDESAFKKSGPEMAPIIKRSLEPLYRDLSDLRATLHACSGPRKPSIQVVDQVRYLVLYKAKLNGFQQKLPAHRASISAIQDLIECQTSSARRESMVRLDGFVEDQERNRTRADDYEKAQSQVVSMFQERISRQSPAIGEKLNTDQLLGSLEDDLVEKGLKRDHAERVLFPITKALLRQPILATLDKRTALPNLEFKLDLFEVKSDPREASKSWIDATGNETRDDVSLAPDEEVDDLDCRR